MQVIMPVLKAVGIDIKDLTLSASKTIRKLLAQNIQETYVPNTPLIFPF